MISHKKGTNHCYLVATRVGDSAEILNVERQMSMDTSKCSLSYFCFFSAAFFYFSLCLCLSAFATICLWTVWGGTARIIKKQNCYFPSFLRLALAPKRRLKYGRMPTSGGAGGRIISSLKLIVQEVLVTLVPRFVKHTASRRDGLMLPALSHSRFPSHPPGSSTNKMDATHML